MLKRSPHSNSYIGSELEQYVNEIYSESGDEEKQKL